ncbi:GNAT family N-acetyltransferase [Curtobacterium sp. NPDC089689]|uniref:GNAT family N-acetyltransferase n=1 Tax=Curtobacterium sp. NPDC089689 TaxID=3363968 RepID=UPI00382DE70E
MHAHVRQVATGDQWSVLYAGYRSFYALPEDSGVVATTWEWVSAGAHGLVGLVATDPDGTLLGLANLRRFARPSTAGFGLYLDDLFTSPDARGQGVATALLRQAGKLASEEGANVVRWITATDNRAARRVYDEVASATPWVTYDMAPAQQQEAHRPG